MISSNMMNIYDANLLILDYIGCIVWASLLLGPPAVIRLTVYRRLTVPEHWAASWHRREKLTSWEEYHSNLNNGKSLITKIEWLVELFCSSVRVICGRSRASFWNRSWRSWGKDYFCEKIMSAEPRQSSPWRYVDRRVGYEATWHCLSSTNLPGGNQVDGLPPVASLLHCVSFWLRSRDSIIQSGSYIFSNIVWCGGYHGASQIFIWRLGMRDS